MSWQNCAARVEAGDPTRFAATMIAPVAAREKLFPLYAFNLELAEAAWASSEPMICLMRLQFWSDALDAIEGGRMVPAHEVLQSLAPLLVGRDLAPLRAMIAARQDEVNREPCETLDALIDHLDAESGGLIDVGLAFLGGVPTGGTRAVARASALANWLAAWPALERRGILPLPDGSDGGIAQAAETGLSLLNSADLSDVPAMARPALWPAFAARHILTIAARTPDRVRAGQLQPPPLRRALILAGTRATGRV